MSHCRFSPWSLNTWKRINYASDSFMQMSPRSKYKGSNVALCKWARGLFLAQLDTHTNSFWTKLRITIEQDMFFMFCFVLFNKTVKKDSMNDWREIATWTLFCFLSEKMQRCFYTMSLATRPTRKLPVKPAIPVIDLFVKQRAILYPVVIRSLSFHFGEAKNNFSWKFAKTDSWK